MVFQNHALLPFRTVAENVGYGSPYVWTSDDRLFVSGGGDIQAVDLADNSAVPIADSPAQEWGPHLSPDEKWVAYTSDESGRYEIYVKPYPALSGAWVVSTEGGEEPVWSRDGRSLFYRNGDTWLEVPVSYKPEFNVGKPRVALEGPYINVPGRSYDVSPDGERFLVVKQAEQKEQQNQQPMALVLNWQNDLRRP